MAKERMFDFDAFWQEAEPQEADRPKVRVFGEDVYLPASIPARIILRAMRAAQEGEDAETPLSGEEVYKSACALYGAERIDAWLDKGLSLSQLADLVNQGIRLYASGQIDDSGNQTAPNRGAKD